MVSRFLIILLREFLISSIVSRAVADLVSAVKVTSVTWFMPLVVLGEDFGWSECATATQIAPIWDSTSLRAAPTLGSRPIQPCASRAGPKSQTRGSESLRGWRSH